MAVYDTFYGFRVSPFALNPDPRFLFFSRGHREALAGLLYAISDRKGFAILTGEVGTGKTTIVHALLNQLADGARSALLFNPSVSRHDLYLHLLAEFGLPAKRSIAACRRHAKPRQCADRSPVPPHGGKVSNQPASVRTLRS